jgi:hypothetical protein
MQNFTLLENLKFFRHKLIDLKKIINFFLKKKKIPKHGCSVNNMFTIFIQRYVLLHIISIFELFLI